MRKTLSLLTAALLATPAAAQPTDSWTAEGRLEEGDSRNAEQHRYDDHLVRLEAGRRYRISLRSDDFDTVLHLLRQAEGEPVAARLRGMW